MLSRYFSRNIYFLARGKEGRLQDGDNCRFCALFWLSFYLAIVRSLHQNYAPGHYHVLIKSRFKYLVRGLFFLLRHYSTYTLPEPQGLG
jgi:hypothetical protein